MRRCRSWYRIHQLLHTHLPRPPGPLADSLALWLQGTLLAENGCLDRVAAARAARGGNVHTLRRRLCDARKDDAERQEAWGADQARDVETCFAPLLAWVLSWRVPPGPEAPPPLVLAVDPTHQADRLVALTVSVVLNQTALPVAWQMVPAQASLSWMASLCRLLARLAPAVAAGMAVPVLCDRGRYSPRLWRHIQAWGWHPCLRCAPDLTFQPDGPRAARPAAGWPRPATAPCQARWWCSTGGGMNSPGSCGRTRRPSTRTRPCMPAGTGLNRASGGSSAPAGRGRARVASTRCARGGTGWCWPWPACWRWPTARAGRKPPPWAGPPHGCARPRLRRRSGRRPGASAGGARAWPAWGPCWPRDGGGPGSGCGPGPGPTGRRPCAPWPKGPDAQPRLRYATSASDPAAPRPRADRHVSHTAPPGIRSATRPTHLHDPHGTPGPRAHGRRIRLPIPHTRSLSHIPVKAWGAGDETGRFMAWKVMGRS